MICNETSKTSFFLALAYAARTLDADTHLLIDAEECSLLLASNLEKPELRYIFYDKSEGCFANCYSLLYQAANEL